MTTIWGAVAATLTGIAAAYAALSAPGRHLARLRVEVDILDRLGDNPARVHVQQLVDAHAEELAERLHVRRFWPGILGGDLLYVIGASMGLGAVRTGESWLVAASGPLFVTAGLGVYSAFRSWTPVPRDREGFRIESARDQAAQ